MATKEEYARWLVANKGKSGTPEFAKVAQAYRQAQAGPAPQEPVKPEVVGGAYGAVGEFASGANRSILGVLDVLPGAINEAAGLMGIEKRIPTFTEALEPLDIGAEKGTFGEEGLATDVAAAAGEALPLAAGMGAAVRGGAAVLDPLAKYGESAAAGLLRQAGTSTPAADVGYGVASAVGGEAGKEVGGPMGEMTGALLAPLAVGGSTALLSKALAAPQTIGALTKNLSSLSDEGASLLLADAMVREGLSPDEAAKRLRALGPNAVPADVSNTFARLLRDASNQVPRIQGLANTTLNQRQAGQAGRLASSLDGSLGVPGLNVDDEIERLRQVTGPQINALYEQARGTPMGLSESLRTMLSGKNSLGSAFRSAQRRVADKRAAGDTITHFDLIDATKQQMDDEIGVALRAGENNRARDLVRLKNIMLEEADATVPGYQEARNAFAGRMALESAAEQGELFLKMPARELQEYVKGMGESELRMFRLGAKQAILDKIDTLQVGSDGVKRLFGRNGDIGKLRNLFPDRASFDQFSNALEREANFSMTRRAAQGNSTTVQQAFDSRNSAEAMQSARNLLSNPTALPVEFGRILTGLAAKRGDRAYVQALEKAGDILLESGMKPKELESLLRSGNAPRIRALLEEVMIKPAGPLIQSGQAAAATAALPGFAALLSE